MNPIERTPEKERLYDEGVHFAHIANQTYDQRAEVVGKMLAGTDGDPTVLAHAYKDQDTAFQVYGKLAGQRLAAEVQGTPESPEVAAFRAEQSGLLAESGWNTVPSIREGLERYNLPVPTADYLAEAFSSEEWAEAYKAVKDLSERFKDAKFADQVSWGIVLVPNPAKLDTRGAIEPKMRHDQHDFYKAAGTTDYVNTSLPKGALIVPRTAKDWTMVATVTGRSGIYEGSYNLVRDDGEVEDFTVAGQDTRRAMIRQIWGARVLQSGTNLPDAPGSGDWTYTVFPGEEKAGGYAPCGYVGDRGRVYFNLFIPDDGRSDVRVAPAVVVGQFSL